jgi:hypothetical protein
MTSLKDFDIWEIMSEVSLSNKVLVKTRRKKVGKQFLCNRFDNQDFKRNPSLRFCRLH